MPETPVTPDTLAAALAARLVHDLSNSAHGIISGFDLHADSDVAELQAEGLALAAASARTLVELLAFCRAAFGRADEAQGAAALERLAQTQFAGRRATLVWSPDLTAFSPRTAQGALILAQAAAGGLPMGGTATLTARRRDEADVVRVEGADPRARLQPEVVAGLAGDDHGVGLAGRWAPARYLGLVARRLGGAVFVDVREGGFTLELTLPAEPG